MDIPLEVLHLHCYTRMTLQPEDQDIGGIDWLYACNRLTAESLGPAEQARAAERAYTSERAEAAEPV